MFSRLAGGITKPLSSTKGTGDPSHSSASFFSCMAESRRSLGVIWYHIVCSRKVMCLVAKPLLLSRVAATTRSCNTCRCNRGQPLESSVKKN